MTIEEGNRIIGEYMGATYEDLVIFMSTQGKHWVYPENENPANEMMPIQYLKYDSDWNWIIPVCTKLGMKVVDVDINKTWQEIVQKVRELGSQ